MSGAKPNLPCVFPFRFDGQVYNRCVSLQGEKPWCSTLTNAFGVHVTGNWGDCDKNSCPMAWINIHIILIFQWANYSSWLSIPVNTVFTHVAKLNQDINYVHHVLSLLCCIYTILQRIYTCCTWFIWYFSRHLLCCEAYHIMLYMLYTIFFYKISYTILCMRYTKLWRIYIML